MYGIVTREPESVTWEWFDRGFYEVKTVAGARTDPIPEAVNMISCFGDNEVAKADRSLLAMDDQGNRATWERQYFDWAYVCPSVDDYREQLLDLVAEASSVHPDVRLDDVGFPREEYCHCERCETRYDQGVYEDYGAFRAETITSFVAEAADRISGRTYLTLYPDPYPGHLYDRNGLDIDAIEPYVDEFVVTLYDTYYGTTYWLESLAKGFQSRLSTPFSIEVYAADVELDSLVHAAEVAENYAKDVYFGYDAANARAAIRRLEAQETEGETFGEPSG